MVRFDEPTRRREPQSRAARLGREVWLEQLLPRLGRDTRPGIDHMDRDRFRPIRLAHTPGRSVTTRETRSREFPYTLDLRTPPDA